ncbi:MAG TPA: hypothetical protein VEZ88_07800, partial [Steroidobacteraceae bacterium]|nr:hypothetical protein [Steroidobacteraceae bacterium]
YLRLAGACADARGAESEYWSLYSLKTTLTGSPSAPVSCPARVFSTTAARRAALVDRVRALRAAGHAVLVAVRTHAEGQALMQELAAAGIGPGILQGASNEADLKVLEHLDEPGAVLLVLHPAERNVARATGRAPLDVVVAELHHAQRQIERICRAFAADTCEIMLALEDEGVATQLGSLVTTLARRGVGEAGECPAGHSRWLAVYAQRGIERACVLMRQDVIARDRQLDDLLAFSGRRE